MADSLLRIPTVAEVTRALKCREYAQAFLKQNLEGGYDQSDIEVHLLQRIAFVFPISVRISYFVFFFPWQYIAQNGVLEKDMHLPPIPIYKRNVKNSTI